MASWCILTRAGIQSAPVASFYEEAAINLMTRFCFISRVAATVSKSKDCEKERNREIDRNGNKSRNAKKKDNKGKWKDQ